MGFSDILFKSTQHINKTFKSNFAVNLSRTSQTFQKEKQLLPQTNCLLVYTGLLEIRTQAPAGRNGIKKGRNNSLRSVSNTILITVKIIGGLNVHLLFVSRKSSRHNLIYSPMKSSRFHHFFINFKHQMSDKFPTKKT